MLLVAGVALWLWRPRETRAYDVGLALLSGAVIALVVFVAQVGFDSRIRDADAARAQEEERQALRLSLGSSRSLEGSPAGICSIRATRERKTPSA